MIVNNRVVGTRITVWDVLHYLDAGWTASEIATTLHLSDGQVAAAVQYITAHRAALDPVHRQIEARKARGNPPAITAQVATSRAKVQAWLQQPHAAKT